MFHAVRALLYRLNLPIPKTHTGLRNLFGQHFLTTGELPKELGRWLGEAFRLRQQSDYEIRAPLAEDRVRKTIERTEAFVEAVEKYASREKVQFRVVISYLCRHQSAVSHLCLSRKREAPRSTL